MTLQQVYEVTGGSLQEVTERLMNEILVKKFVLRFLNDASFAQLKTSLEQKDWDTAFRAAHTLKGVCLNLDFVKLAKSSSDMTECLRGGFKGDENEVNALFARVEEDYTAAFNAIKQFAEASV